LSLIAQRTAVCYSGKRPLRDRLKFEQAPDRRIVFGWVPNRDPPRGPNLTRIGERDPTKSGAVSDGVGGYSLLFQEAR
jgi:hypothetical protein